MAASDSAQVGSGPPGSHQLSAGGLPRGARSLPKAGSAPPAGVLIGQGRRSFSGAGGDSAKLGGRRAKGRSQAGSYPSNRSRVFAPCQR